MLSALEEGTTAWLTALAPMALVLTLAGEMGWVPVAREALETLGDVLDPSVRALIEQGIWAGPAFLGLTDGLSGLERAADAARHAGNRRVELQTMGSLTLLLTATGNHARARPLLAWLDRNMLPESSLRWMVDLAKCLAAIYDGNFDVGRAQGEAMFARYPILPNSSDAGVSLIALWTGDRALALRAFALVSRGPDTGVLSGYKTWVRAIIHLIDDDLEGAARTLRDWPPSFGYIDEWARINAADTALALDDIDGGERLLDDCESRLAGTALNYIRTVLLLARAYVSMRRGEIAAAEARAHEALESALTHEIPLATTDALEAIAVLAAETDDTTQAARLLGAAEAFRARTGYSWRYPHHRRAIATARERLDPAHLAEGAALSLTEAAEYARRGRGQRRRPNHGWESLTPSELRVVELVAAGHPNQAIAKTLFVSLATVKTHLVHVYAKLDLRTRAELAAAATRRGLSTAADAPRRSDTPAR